MSKMMIYAPKGAVGGNVEKVWGHEMQVMTVDSSDKKAVDAAKANGYSNSPNDVIEQIEAQKMQKENDVMKAQLGGGLDDAMKKRADELEEQLTTALEEIAGFEQEREESSKVIDEKIARIAELENTNDSLKGDLDTSIEWTQELIGKKNELEAKLAIYEESKDVNGDGVVSYDEMTNKELSKLLTQRNVEHNVRDGKDALIKAAQDSE